MNDRNIVVTFPVRRNGLMAVQARSDVQDEDEQPPPAGKGVPGHQSSPVGQTQIFFTSDIAGRLTHVSAAYYRYTGGGAIVASRTTMFPAVDPRDIATTLADWSVAVAARSFCNADLRLVGADGVSRWFRLQSTPLWTTDGRFEGWSGVCVDIDELKQKQATLRANDTRHRRAAVKQRAADGRWRDMQTDLAQATQSSAMEHMAKTLAHELNQPLSAASMYAKAAVRALDNRDERSDAVAAAAANHAVEQVLRAAAIVRNLRDFVSTGECQRSRESLRTIIEEAAAFALIDVEDLRVAVRFALDETSHVFVNRVQIQQVLINLIRNAIEAMEGLHRRELELTLHAEADNVAVVSVADTGRGIAADVADRLFAPCVSAKRNGKGLGLSISRAIIEAHRGRIWAENAPNGGAFFRFSLPMIEHGPIAR